MKKDDESTLRRQVLEFEIKTLEGQKQFIIEQIENKKAELGNLTNGN